MLIFSGKFIHKNAYLLLGIALGFILGYINQFSDCEQEQLLYKPTLRHVSQVSSNSNVMPSLATPKDKSATNKNTSQKLVRPRFFSTELGIREKLFVGIFTSEEKINTQTVYINRTLAHLVDKIKFFITVRSKMKSVFDLPGIVGFTDARSRYRPFQIIKYISDTFLENYDYYLLANDFNHLNIRRIKEAIEKISISKDVYLGTTVQDSSFCSLDAGVILSNSVIRALKENLNWCITNAVSDDRSENFGRCVQYSINLECQTEIQGQTFKTYKLKHFSLEKYFEKLTRRKDFQEALSIYPILKANEFYLLGAYFSRLRLEVLHQKINDISKNLKDSWPPGQNPGAKPATRFDLAVQTYFNMTHVFFPDDFTNIRKHKQIDLLDMEKTLETIKKYYKENGGNKFQYRRLINGYRTVDISRGVDYILDLGFRDLTTGKEVIQRFQVCKPLSKVEFIPAPYVTENSRITILLPVEEANSKLAFEFIVNYHSSVMERNEKCVLMLVFIYQYSSPSRGSNDTFATIKQMAVKLSNKYQSDDNKILWVSVRLPFTKKSITLNEKPVLNFALTDLALKKIGLENLILVLDVYTEISVEFLNRVRMNTVLGFQIFSPIPFRQYDPNVTKMVSFELNKSSGHFDRDQYRYISFYGRDYVFARKQAQKYVPIIRTDNDIPQILENNDKGNIFEMFIKHSISLHCMRATEKNLKVRYHEETDEYRENLFFGTKVQLGKMMLQMEEKIGLLS